MSERYNFRKSGKDQDIVCWDGDTGVGGTLTKEGIDWKAKTINVDIVKFVTENKKDECLTLRFINEFARKEGLTIIGNNLKGN